MGLRRRLETYLETIDDILESFILQHHLLMVALNLINTSGADKFTHSFVNLHFLAIRHTCHELLHRFDVANVEEVFIRVPAEVVYTQTSGRRV
jgi:hypothetical protein